MVFIKCESKAASLLFNCLAVPLDDKEVQTPHCDSSVCGSHQSFKPLFLCHTPVFSAHLRTANVLLRPHNVLGFLCFCILMFLPFTWVAVPTLDFLSFKENFLSLYFSRVILGISTSVLWFFIIHSSSHWVFTEASP